MKPWHIIDEPSQFASKFKRWSAYIPSATGLLIASFLALATVWSARFYQAEPAPVVGITKGPESLCLTLALPPSGRRVPSPPRALLLVHSSYRLMRRSCRLSSSSVVASFEESMQVATRPCSRQNLPDVISTNPYSDAWSLTTTVPPSALACFFLGVIGLPQNPR